MSSPINVANTSVIDLIDYTIKNTFIIDYGTISKIYDPTKTDLVQVQIGACTGINDFNTFPCILCSTCASNMSISIDPKVGDKVIVFYPRRYDASMLDTTKQETIVNADTIGYSYGKGLAFLATQFFDNDGAVTKNHIHVTNTGINITTDKAVTLTAKGDTTINVTGVTKLNINGATINISEDGAIDIKAAATKTTTINGHLEVS